MVRPTLSFTVRGALIKLPRILTSSARRDLAAGRITVIGPVGRGATPRDSRSTALARWSRFASAGLVVVIVGMSAFALWASQTSAHAARETAAANRLAADYLTAAQAIGSEESLERRYRLSPSRDSRAAHAAAARTVITALTRVRDEGQLTDARSVQAVLRTHARYLVVTDKVFAAVDRGDTDLVVRLESTEADPLFSYVQDTVDRAANQHQADAQAELAALRGTSTTLAEGVALVLLVGLTMALMLTAVLRRYRRDLDAERAQTIHDSLHDSLTGLPNRQLLTERLDAAAASGVRVGLVLIDLDRFKEINDTLGHGWGDELLTHIGPRLMATVRATDTVARLGGDEFAILLPEVTGLDDVMGVAEKLRLATEMPLRIAGADLSVEASAGVVISGEHGDDAQILLQRAEVAMYVAKSRKRGLAAYEPSEDFHDPSRLALLAELRRGIDLGELTLYYQPKLSLATGRIDGVEALVRWEHPERGIVPPDKFIPLAEHTGLIGPLTRFVVDSALRQARTWLDAGRPLQVAVNLAARNLADPHLADDILRALANHEVPAHLLCLELTESAITTEPERALELMLALRAAGVSFAVDDFGTGYTSLGQLRNLPLTELKVDRSFVATMTTERSNAVIVRSIVDLAANLGLTTVAEGVEDADTLALLASYGCAVAQGFYMSRPLPADAFDRWYAQRHADRLPIAS
jgi:diguanylate cyclase (GGDEF)-like protein